jgi:hypothetical protein
MLLDCSAECALSARNADAFAHDKQCVCCCCRFDMTYISFVPEDSSSSSSNSSSDDTATPHTSASNDQVTRRLTELGVPPSFVQLPAFQLTDLYAAGLYHDDGTAPSPDEVNNI